MGIVKTSQPHLVNKKGGYRTVITSGKNVSSNVNVTFLIKLFKSKLFKAILSDYLV